MASNGGIPAPLNLWLLPSFISGGQFWTLDPTNFNDSTQASSYSWKVEDIIPGRQGTINRVIISYRDLGVATITVTLSGSNDAQAPVSVSQDVSIGTVGANGKIKTVLVGISLSALNLQLTIFRANNAGPVSLTKIRLEGEVEATTY